MIPTPAEQQSLSYDKRPGSEWHLTMLMAPHGLNMVVGQDRQHLLAFGRSVWNAALVATQPAEAAMTPDVVAEAMRRRLVNLPRYSFLLDDEGNVRRVPDRSGNWLDFQQVHEQFDPVMVDAALAASGGKEQSWRMVCGDWRDELVAIHGPNGHIVSGLTTEQAIALIAAHGGEPLALAASGGKEQG